MAQLFYEYHYHAILFMKFYTFFHITGDVNEDYKVVSKFNQLNRKFTLAVRRHLKNNPCDYFMYHEDARGYSKFI